MIPQKLPASAVWKILPNNAGSNVCETVTLGKSANRTFAKNLFFSVNGGASLFFIALPTLSTKPGELDLNC